MTKLRGLMIDDETWEAFRSYATDREENHSAVARDIFRAFLSRRGYRFTTEPRRYGRRGNGRQAR